jgi:hypothetical protein
MLEPDASKRPKNMQVVVQRLQSMQVSQKEVITRYTKTLCWSLLIGSFPYPLLIVISIPSVNAILGTSTSILPLFFFAFWPLIILTQLIAAIICIFTPRRRLLGAGIIVTMLALLLAILSGWLPLLSVFQFHERIMI